MEEAAGVVLGKVLGHGAQHLLALQRAVAERRGFDGVAQNELEGVIGRICTLTVKDHVVLGEDSRELRRAWSIDGDVEMLAV